MDNCPLPLSTDLSHKTLSILATIFAPEIEDNTGSTARVATTGLDDGLGLAN